MSSIVFPDGGRALVEQMCEKFPELHVNDDDKQRELTTRIQQQFVHEYGDRWGGKKRTGLDDSFKSKDSMAYLEQGNAVSTWDMFQGNAEATILVHDGMPPNHPDLPPSEAVFMEVDAINWLGAPDIPDLPDLPDSENKDDEILEELDRAAQVQARDTAMIIARDDLNTQRIIDELDRINNEMQETLKKVLAAYLIANRPELPVVDKKKK